MKNGFTKKENERHYKYLMNKVYNLPFKSNINKTIDKEIKMICKKNKIYKDFGKYLITQWSPYFKDNILVLRNIDIKFRTNNSIENFNKFFKLNVKMKDNMHLLEYLDNLIEFSKNQIEFFKDNINKKSKFKNETVDVNDESNLILEEIEDVISENIYDNLFVDGDVKNDKPEKNNINKKKVFIIIIIHVLLIAL